MELRLILVGNCNYDCYFCLNEYYGSKDSKFNLLTDDYRAIVKVAKSLSIKRVTLTGGEPTLRKDLFEIISMLKEEGMHVTLITNGHILDKRILTMSLIDELHVSFHAMTLEAWKKVTGNTDGLEIVRNNIKLARSTNPLLRIKLNIVSLVHNNTIDQINLYLDFARKFELELNIFQEGYFKMLELLGIDQGIKPQPTSWWNLDSFEKEIVEHKLRKTVYLIENVLVGLSYTSTDKISWDSIWIDPKGGCYCDVKQETSVLNLKEAVTL